MSFIDKIDGLVNAFFSYLPQQRPSAEIIAEARLIAHRGAHDRQKQIVENTDEAFAQALELNCWGIEFDVHATADQVLVVNHDATLKRLWDQDKAIKDLPFRALREMVPEIPTLDEVVSRYGKKMHLFIELKAPFEAETQLQGSLKSLSPCDDYHLLSLDEEVFNHLSSFPSDVMLLVPEYSNVEAFCNLSLNKEYGGVLGHYLLLTNKKIKRLRLAKQHVGVGFVDSEYSLYRELSRGVYWLFSNRVSQISNYLKAP